MGQAGTSRRTGEPSEPESPSQARRREGEPRKTLGPVKPKPQADGPGLPIAGRGGGRRPA